MERAGMVDSTIKQMEVAIVTGASSGLGKEFVRQLSARENLDEIWVIARREEQMNQLKGLVATPLRVLPMDLTETAAMDHLAEQLAALRPNVRWLVNAAGFGKLGTYRDISLQDCKEMINLNCSAAVAVTQTVLPYMTAGGQVLEICSSSAFQPLPGLNVYSATKAFLLQYSRALRWELFDREINVTACCPYWVKDTQFIPVAKAGGNDQAVQHFPFAGKKREVVRRALRDCKLGLAVSTPGGVASVQRAAAKLLPKSLVMGAWELLRRL